MSLSTDRKLSKALSYLGIITLLAIAVILLNIPAVQTYTREAYLYNTMIANGGCAWSECPQLVILASLEETNGLLPPSHYAQGTRMKMRATCTYTPNVCK